jgi:hypothetical protein
MVQPTIIANFGEGDTGKTGSVLFVVSQRPMCTRNSQLIEGW